MTEAEWLTATRPTLMLEFLRDKASDRKLRLFACACCRRIWSLIDQPPFREAVDVAEMYADGLITGKVLKSLAKRLNLTYRESWNRPEVSRSAAKAALRCLGRYIYVEWHPSVHDAAVWSVTAAAPEHDREKVCELEHAGQVTLLRDIFGNPSRPVTINPSWLTSTVVSLATGIYNEKAFDRMPILADALQDAGCNNEDILIHCRQPGEHVRGCFVIDLVLGKS